MRQKNVRTMERSWRKKSKRGVSPIIATILLVAITVVLAAVLYILISGLTKGPGNTPIGTALALGSPAEASNAAANHWYNFSVQSAGGGLTLGSLAFQVQTSSGGIVTLPGGAAITVLGLTGNTVGTYNIASGSWASGGTTPATSQMTIVVYSAATSLSGDNFVVSGSGSFSGTISVSIA
jgi:flagellin-like protein